MRDATGMLTYVILLLLGVVEIIFAMLLVKAVARIPWGWLRWPVGVLLVAAAAYVSLGVVVTTLGRGRLDEWWFWFRRDYPLPTFRLFILGICITFPAIMLLYVLRGLWRDRDRQVPRARLWPLKRVLAWLAGIVAIMVAVGVVNDWMIRREIAAFEERGRKLAQSVAPPTCDDADNAAIPYAQAVALVQSGPKRPRGNLDDLKGLTGTDWREFVAANRHAADLLREGARRPRCRFEANWGHANALDDLQPASEVGAVAVVLYAESTQQLFDGNADEAFSSVAVLRRVAEHLNTDPRFLVQRMGMGVERLAMKLLEHALYVRAPTEHEVAACVRPSFEFRASLLDSLTWNEAEACTAVADMYLWRLAIDDDEHVLRTTPVLAVNLFLMRFFYARDDMYALPFHFKRRQWNAQLSYAEWTDEKIRPPPEFRVIEEYQLFGAYAGLATPALVPFPTQLWVSSRADSQRRISDLGLVVGRDHLLPRILEFGPDQVVPLDSRPVDPQDARPLRVAIADGGAVIYSVGGDRKDDGGRDGPFDEEGDITFCLGEAFRVRRL